MDMQIITNGQQTCLFGLSEVFVMQLTEMTMQPDQITMFKYHEMPWGEDTSCSANFLQVLYVCSQ